MRIVLTKTILLVVLIIIFTILSTSHAIHLGSTTLVTNQSGDIVEENFYEPFGQIYSGEEESRYLYTGQELDQDTDLYYYGARYYDLELPLDLSCFTCF